MPAASLSHFSKDVIRLELQAMRETMPRFELQGIIRGVAEIGQVGRGQGVGIGKEIQAGVWTVRARPNR